MKYKLNDFLIDGFKAKILAKKYSTPLYCYSLKKIKENIKNFQKSFKLIDPLVCFAVKANPNKVILRQMGKLGLGADVVSIGELMKALKSGIKPNKIVFSGVGKTSYEIAQAIKKSVLLINAESKSEILEIERIAKIKKRKVNVGVRLNPNTDAKTLSQISTGKKENKFGILEKDLLNIIIYIKNSKYLSLKCLSVHIGSQILDHAPYEKMLKVLKKIIDKSKFKFEYIDLGGGMGIDYENKNKRLNLNRYSKSIEKILIKSKSKIIFEPGRSIIGNSGTLLTKVIYIKDSESKKFIILDAAMNDLMRPALYGAIHKTLPVIKSGKVSKKTYEFVGPICESTDKFVTIKNFQELQEKDYIAICDVGAYGMSLSSNYNLRTKPLEILIKNNKIKIIRKRQKHKDLI
jgi:diaminopimelate decarboxylase